MDRKRQEGFTLVELAVVLIVAGVILAISAPALRRYLESYRVGDAARQIQSELRLARQKAVTNGTRNWFFAFSPGIYYTGVQTQRSDLTWNPSVAWTQWNMPTNTQQLSPNFGGLQYLYYTPDGIPHNASATSATSGSIRICSSTSMVHDTVTVNVDLTGQVWQ